MSSSDEVQSILDSILRHGNGTMRRMLPVFIVLLAGFHSGFAFADAGKLDRAGSVRVEREVELSSDVIPQWCYDREPSVVFAEDLLLYRMDLAGEKTLLRTLDGPIDDLTLRCSSDGRVIFYLNVRHDVAHIIQDGVESEYALSEEFTNVLLRYGSLMSPDGSAFAIDVDHLVSGPDVLSNKRLLELDLRSKRWSHEYLNVFWLRDYVIVSDLNRSSERAAAYRSEPIGDRAATRELMISQKSLVDVIGECAPGQYIITYDDEKDDVFAYAFDPNSPNARKRVLRGKVLGLLNPFDGGCMIPIMSEATGIMTAVSLLIMSDGRSANIILPENKFFGPDFYLSKDRKFAVNYQSLPWEHEKKYRGKLVIMKIVYPN